MHQHSHPHSHQHNHQNIHHVLHNLGDAAGLGLAWAAAWLASRAPTDRHTFGWRRATQLSPLMNAILLVAFSGALLWESFRRLGNPPEVPGLTLMWAAGTGIKVNLGTAALYYRGQHSD